MAIFNKSVMCITNSKPQLCTLTGPYPSAPTGLSRRAVETAALYGEPAQYSEVVGTAA